MSAGSHAAWLQLRILWIERARRPALAPKTTQVGTLVCRESMSRDRQADVGLTPALAVPSGAAQVVRCRFLRFFFIGCPL